MNVPFLSGEYWYGGASHDGVKMPIGANDCYEIDCTKNETPNQMMPLFLSSKGRCLWAREGFHIRFNRGEIVCDDCAVLTECGETLKDAFQYAAGHCFSVSGKAPDAALWRGPMFNTWIELTFYQTQEAVLRYARGIVENGFTPGVLMIDDGWAEYYGGWRFHSGRFPDAAAMLRELHDMGFQVMMWVVPYISPDTMAYRHLKEIGALICGEDGEPYITRWWNGCSAVLDIGRKEADDWMHGQLKALMDLGVDGFKFDGGDCVYYPEQEGAPTPKERCEAWVRFGAQYALNEYRASWMGAGLPVMQRLCDKPHSWGTDGLGALIPNMLAQGITGHPFCCADMVGGGEYLNFAENSDSLDEELFVCHSAVSCLTPGIQFSAAPWRVLGKEANEAIHRQLALRTEYLPVLEQVLRQSAQTGEPAVRYLEYEFPGEGCERITDCFMLGDALLIAPALEPKQAERRVYVPKGVWETPRGEMQSGGEWCVFPLENALPIVLRRKKGACGSAEV